MCVPHPHGSAAVAAAIVSGRSGMLTPLYRGEPERDAERGLRQVGGTTSSESSASPATKPKNTRVTSPLTSVLTDSLTAPGSGRP